MKKRIFVGSLIVVILVLLGVFFYKNFDSLDKSIDYNDYIGYWFEDSDDCNQDYVYIKNIEGNMLTIDIFIYREYGDEISIVLNDGYGEFETEFVYGSIYLNDDKVSFSVDGESLDNIERNYDFVYASLDDLNSREECLIDVE